VQFRLPAIQSTSGETRRTPRAAVIGRYNLGDDSLSLLLTATLVAIVVTVTAAMLAALLVICVDRERRRLYRHDPGLFRDRLRAIAPFVAVLVGILLVNKGLQTYIVAFSYRYGVEPTAVFYTLEGNAVAGIQGAFPGWSTMYLSGMYVFGYAVLLTFPLVAYLFASSTRPLKTLVAAYGINYAVAIVCYSAVRAYGPRTYHEQSESATTVNHGLVDLFPDIVYLTSLVNSQTNVFPSLHTSLSLTVLAVAVMTHAEFPRWTLLAFVFATSIVLATVVLGIHWLIDVGAGIVLAAGSVYLARAIVTNPDRSHPAGTLERYGSSDDG